MSSERIVQGKVEKTAQIWGERRLQRDLERGKRPKRGPVIKVVDIETSEALSKLPKLAYEDPKLIPRSPRYDSLTGGVHNLFWEEKKVQQDENGRRYLDSAENFVQLITGKERRVDLTNLPLRPVSRLQLKYCPDIESAIRQAYHVQERYIGEEAEQLDIIWNQINHVWSLVLEKQITQDNLKELALQTALVLEDAGLTRARKTAKTNIESRLLKVFTKDRLERINPLGQRIRLRSVYLEAIGLEAFSVLVKEKFAAVAGILLMEREITRHSLADVNEALEKMMGLGNHRGASIFLGEKPREGELKGVEVVLKGIVNLLLIPRVAPYLTTARAAGIALWGGQPKYAEVNRAVIGEETANILLNPNFKPVRTLVKEEKFKEAKNLAEAWVYDPIQTLLDGAVIGMEFP